MSAIFSPAPPTALVLGAQGTSADVWAEIGTVDRTDADPVAVTLTSTMQTSDPANGALLQLVDLATSIPVPGSALKSNSSKPETLSTPPIKVPAGSYSIQLALVTADPKTRAVCTSAVLVPA